jgi:hypothetical protein
MDSNISRFFPHQRVFLSAFIVCFPSENGAMSVLIELVSFISQDILNLLLTIVD